MGAVPGRQSYLQSGALGRGGGVAAGFDRMDRGRSAGERPAQPRAGRARRRPACAAADAACDTTARRPHIIMLLDESSFDVTAAPDIKVPAGYSDYFKSIDGKQRTMIAESTGGPTWYTEFNVLTGLSARSFGDLKFYVTRIAAGRVTRGLPQALQNCGYKTISLYPTYGDFLSARAFQKGAGVEQFIDMADMGVNEDMQPDKFYFDQALKVFEREQSQQSPVFMFVYLTANHFPWTDVYRPDLTPPGWTPPGNTAEVDEYIRRQTMTAKDYGEFTARLKRDYPDQSFLVLRFGDHQPAISQKLLEPGIDQKSLAKRLMATDPRYYSTYYAIDGINYRPARPVVGARNARCGLYPARAAGSRRHPARSVVHGAEEHHAPLQRDVLCLQEGRGSPQVQPPPDRRRHDQGALRSLLDVTRRHCEERSDEAIHASACCAMDCFAFARNDGRGTPTSSPPSPTATAPPRPASSSRRCLPRANWPRASWRCRSCRAAAPAPCATPGRRRASARAAPSRHRAGSRAWDRRAPRDRISRSARRWYSPR